MNHLSSHPSSVQMKDEIGDCKMKLAKPIVILMTTLLLAACTLGGGQTPAPTQDVSQTLDAARTSAVQTFEAEQASKATATPLPPTPTPVDVATLEPTPTQVPTLEPTFTLPALLPTNTRPPAGNVTVFTSTPVQLDCGVTILSPAYLSQFAPYGDIDAKWTVKNTGAMTWGATDVDVKFVSGQKMNKYDDTFDLGKNVAKGDSIDILVDMLAPALPGTYRTTWGLTYAGSTFCTFSINIVVK